MTELDAFLMQWEREYATTARVLGNLPPTAMAFRPRPKSMSAGDLAWHFVQSERFFVDSYLAGKAVQEKGPEPPATLHGILQAYALTHQALADRVRKAPEGWTRTMPFFGQDYPGSVLLQGIMLSHMVHHRGQLSVYLRLLGAKVPSIYGPTADEAMQAG